MHFLIKNMEYLEPWPYILNTTMSYVQQAAGPHVGCQMKCGYGNSIDSVLNIFTALHT